MVYSLRPSDTIWRHKFGSTLAQVTACCLTAPTITWTNVDLSSVRSSGIHHRAILQEIPQQSVVEISLKITYLKICSNLPGANELIQGSGQSDAGPTGCEVMLNVWESEACWPKSKVGGITQVPCHVVKLMIAAVTSTSVKCLNGWQITTIWCP